MQTYSFRPIKNPADIERIIGASQKGSRLTRHAGGRKGYTYEVPEELDPKIEAALTAFMASMGMTPCELSELNT